jgi:hypothetical protein
MLRARLLILAPISAALLSLLPSALGTDHPKPAGQALAQWPGSSPIHAPVAMGAGRSVLPTTLSSSPNAAIVNPVLPPSPTSPATFRKGVAIPITGTAAGTGFQSFLVEWAPGLDATSGWQTIGVTLAGGGSSPVTNGPLATWDTSSVTNVGYYTIRLTVTISNSPFQALTMVYLEPDLLSANWPQYFNLGPALGAGVVPARNVDGTFRLVMETPAGPSAAGGQFWTLPLNGTAQPTVHKSNGSFMQPSVADFNGGPGDDAMVIDFITGTPVFSNLEMFQKDGTFSTLASSPNLWNVGSQLVVEDLAGDSNWETVGYGIDYTNQVADIYAWRADGTQLNGTFPVKVPFLNPNDGRLNRNPLLVGDLNGDGKKEVVAMEVLSPTTFSLALFANDGSPLTWQVPTLAGTPVVMAAADLDNNGKLETILAANTDTQTFLHAFQPDGTERPGWPLTLFNSNIASQSYLAVGDLNQDGSKQIVYAHESFLYVLKGDGSNFSAAWPLQASPANEGFGYNAVAIGDVDGDGFPEIVTVLNTLSSNSDPFFALGSYADQKLLAIRRDATISKSWQLNAGNGCWLQFWPTPAIGDFDQDGITDIAVAFQVGAGACPTASSGVVTILSTGAKFNPGLNDWPLVRHDPRNTSVLLCSDFCVGASSPQTVTAGSPAIYALTITPNELPYTTAITSFTCTGLPTGASCNFNLSSITPGVASTSSVNLSISTTSRTLAQARPPSTSPRFLLATCFGAGGLVLVPLFVVPNKRPSSRRIMFLVFLVISSLLGVSCSGGGSSGPQQNPNGTPSGTYSIIVSATGASKIARTANLKLTVN